MAAAGGSRTDLEVLEGLHCASCVTRLEGALSRIPGVDGARVNLATREAAVDYAPSVISATAIAERLADAGFVARERPREPRPEARSRIGQDAGDAVVAATAVMLIAMLGQHGDANTWFQAAATLWIALFPARSIMRRAIAGLLRLR